MVNLAALDNSGKVSAFSSSSEETFAHGSSPYIDRFSAISHLNCTFHIRIHSIDELYLHNIIHIVFTIIYMCLKTDVNRISQAALIDRCG